MSALADVYGNFSTLLPVKAESVDKSQFQRKSVHSALTVGFILAVLNNKLSGRQSTLLKQQIEYLDPVLIGDSVTARLEIIGWSPDKKIVTFKTDCYNQDGKQLVTGQAVILFQES
ncbi:MAG: hypothetical protein ABFD29_03280 [Anaerolineaceae bacterium]